MIISVLAGVPAAELLSAAIKRRSFQLTCNFPKIHFLDKNLRPAVRLQKTGDQKIVSG
jgi:hypothetical protein